MKYIISGASGNLGKHIFDAIGSEIYAMPRSFDEHALKMMDLSDDEICLIHCAGDIYTSFNMNPALVLENNVLLTGRMLELCLHANIKKFIYISSCAVYGVSQDTSENSNLFPVNINGISKKFNEEIIVNFCDHRKINWTILRLFNIYGGIDKFSVIHKMISSIRQSTHFFLNNGGEDVRDFIHVNDAAAIAVKILKSNFGNQVFNIGSGEGVSINYLIECMEARLQKKIILKQAGGNNPTISISNNKKLLEYIDYRSMPIERWIQNYDPLEIERII